MDHRRAMVFCVYSSSMDLPDHGNYDIFMIVTDDVIVAHFHLVAIFVGAIPMGRYRELSLQDAILVIDFGQASMRDKNGGQGTSTVGGKHWIVAVICPADFQCTYKGLGTCIFVFN